jgi:HK97 family phage prohead protease
MKREKRNMAFRNLEIRSAEKEGKKYIEGIIPYDSKSVPMGGITEIIGRTAFNKMLKDEKEVVALWNHNASFILGSTKSGTLDLEDTEDGLICRCALPNTSYANDLYEIVSRGDVKTMSFAFHPVKWQDLEDGKLRILREVKLDEVSFGVHYAAYPETDSQAFMRGFMKRKIDIESINAILEKEELTEEDLTALKETVNSLNNLIKEKSPEKEDEAAEAEPPKKDTPEDTGTSPENKEDKEVTEEKEAARQELLALIDVLFDIEKEKEEESSETEKVRKPND